MGKIIQLLLLLSCITTLTYGLPLSSDDSNESSSSSSSSVESIEHPNVPHAFIGNSQPISTNPNIPNRSRRDTVHTNGHQGGPDESPHGRVIQPQVPNNGNQNRQVRDTDGQHTPVKSFDSNPTSSSSTEQPSVPHVLIGNSQPVSTNSNTPNRSRRDTVHTNGHQGGPDESPHGRVVQPPHAPTNGNQNRQVRDTEGQQTPAKIFDSNPTTSSSTEQPDRYSTLNRNAQTPGTDQTRYNRQASDFGQQTPRRVLSSNPNSPSSTEQTDTNPKTQSTNTGGYQSRQVRGTDDLQVPRLLLSTTSTTSTETPTNKDTTLENTETRNDKNDQTETDSGISKPNVSSTQIPGDLYGENLRKTDENREKRETNNQDNVPRVFASNANDQTPQTPSAQKVPVNVQNSEHKDRNIRETSSEKSSTEDPDQVRIVKLDGSTPYGRFQQ